MAVQERIENLQELIKNSIGGTVVDQSAKLLLPPGENFGSIMYKVEFTVRHEDHEETMHAVAKCTPPNKVTQEIFNTQQTFKSEIAWYTTVIPTIQQFQRDNGMERVADFFQKFYGSRISLNPESEVVDLNGVILTQNLTNLGYKNIDRHVGFDLRISKAILRDLATFHAVPIAIKLKNPELFDKNIRSYIVKFGFDGKETSDDKDVYEDIKKGIAEIPECTPFMSRISANLKKNQAFKTIFDVNEPWGGICHNDFWTNNIMVKEADDAIKTMILDLQAPCYASIAIDLVFFLIVSVQTDVVKERMDELIRYYYDEFIQNLNQLDIDTDLFPYEDFLREIDTAARDGQFGHAIFLTYVVMADKGSTFFDSSDEKFKTEDLDKARMVLNERHKEKYKWIVLEFARRNWI